MTNNRDVVREFAKNAAKIIGGIPLTNPNNRSADDVIVFYRLKETRAFLLKTLNLSELADKASNNHGAKANSIDYYDGFVDGIEFFLSKIREAMK